MPALVIGYNRPQGSPTYFADQGGQNLPSRAAKRRAFAIGVSGRSILRRVRRTSTLTSQPGMCGERINT
jgi:hypothetical protein